MDQYRYNVAKIRYLVSNGKISDLLDDDNDNDDDDSDVDNWHLQTQESMGGVRRVCDTNNSSNLVRGAEFAKLLRRHWSEIPSLGVENGINNGDSKKTSSEPKNDIRRCDFVESDRIRSHASNFVCHSKEEVEGYCEMISKCQTELILAPSSNNDISTTTAATTTTTSDEKMRISMPPGLRNLGATCYLNSQLQCLAQNLGFVHGLFTWRNVGAEDSRMSKVLSNMQSILARMKYGPQSVICTNEFATALSLENDEMQDPNEVSAYNFSL